VLPWLIDLGLGVVDLGLVAAATAILLESVPSSLKRRRAQRRATKQRADEDSDDQSEDP
jgi:hypothetical protein